MTAEAVPLAIDLSTVGAFLRQRVKSVAIGVLAGAVVAAGILLFVAPRFDGQSLILIRTQSLDPTSLVSSRMGPLAELLPGALGGGANEELATELALLSSRATLGTVVDSLRLQVVMRSPGRVPPSEVVDSLRVVGRFRPVKLSLVRGANHVAGGTIWAKRSADIRLLDREDAIDELTKRLSVDKRGGDAIGISYSARDSVTAAEVPNLVAAVYMARRHTVDRGLNQRRMEFLVARDDSLRMDLRRTADEMANVAERSGTGASPDIAARALAEEAGALEAKTSELRAAESSLDSLIVAARGGRMDARALAAFPDLLRSPALNELVTEIARVETERTVLLGRVPETSPQAIALARARDSLSAQLLPMASSYRASLERQLVSMQADLTRVHAQLSRLPAQAAAVGKEQADLTRLAQLNAGMGAQVLEARLAAMLEGGDVRVIDAAVSPRKASFPRPAPTIAVCLIGGALAGFAYVFLSMTSAAAATRSI